MITKVLFVVVIINLCCFSQWVGMQSSEAETDKKQGKATSLNLEVPIELGMIPCGSRPDDAHDFNRTKVRLNDADYDGNPRWYFEIVAYNTDHLARTVTLKTDSGIKAAIEVPANTPHPTRYRTGPFVPDSGWALYYLSLPPTTSDYQLVVWARRIIIQQTSATTTRIQIPLFGRPANPHLYSWAIYNEGPPVWPRVTSNASSGVWEELGHTRRWEKEASKYAELAPGTPWTFEAIMQVEKKGPPGNYCTLWNETTNEQVAASELANTESTYTLHHTDFQDDASGFTDGHEFGIRTKGYSSNPPRVAGAVLYVKLINLSKAQVLYAVGYENMIYGNQEAFDDYSRAFIDVSMYSSPTFYHESFGSCADNENMLFLRTDEMQRTGTGGTDVIGSGIHFSSNQMARIRTGPITMTGANNYYIHSLSSPKTKIVRTNWLVIDVNSSTSAEPAIGLGHNENIVPRPEPSNVKALSTD